MLPSPQKSALNRAVDPIELHSIVLIEINFATVRREKKITNRLDAHFGISFIDRTFTGSQVSIPL